MKKLLGITILGIILIFGGIFAWDATKIVLMKRYFSTFKPPAIPVETAFARLKKWQPSMSVIATVRAKQEVTIASEVAGIVQTIHFKEGQPVRRGALLVQLDDRVNQAERTYQKAAYHFAKQNNQRYKKLLKTRTISQSIADDYRNREVQAAALLEKSQQIIAQKAIKAPFSGFIGLRLVEKGQYIRAGQAIARLYSPPPFQVRFALPESMLGALYIGQSIQVRTHLEGPVVAYGRIQAMDVASDPETHQLLVKGQLRTMQPQKKHRPRKRLPGEFVYVSIKIGQPRSVVFVPKTSVTYRTYGSVVYIVRGGPGGDLHVEEQRVTVGDRVGDQVIILKGLSAKTRVVISGQLRLYQGARVALAPSLPHKRLH